MYVTWISLASFKVDVGLYLSMLKFCKCPYIIADNVIRNDEEGQG
jgi:hypothetical protein